MTPLDYQFTVQIVIEFASPTVTMVTILSKCIFHSQVLLLPHGTVHLV